VIGTTNNGAWQIHNPGGTTVIKRIQMIGISTFAVSLVLPPPVAHAQDSLFVTTTGNVGIGTTTPEAPLEVQRSTSGLMMQLEAAGDVFFRQKNSATGRHVDINFINDEFRINFGTSGVGPELRLTNAGNLIVTGAYTPDYVFEPDYPLMPLDELAEFVAREKHLPNVPNAAEVAEQGLNVNVFPMQLLEKIEELTLYAIAQQRIVEGQQKQLAAQQATIAELAAKVEGLEEK
jgi:hypothetical protein